MVQSSKDAVLANALAFGVNIINREMIRPAVYKVPGFVTTQKVLQ